MINKDKILIIDFGSQYSQLILRKLREWNVFGELMPCTVNLEYIIKTNPKGIILSGSPFSVFEENSPRIDKKIFELDIPILGICYGMQLISFLMKGTVEKSNEREYGKAELIKNSDDLLLLGIPNNSVVWMSHSDKVTSLPSGFKTIASTISTEFAAITDNENKIWGIQFHPEVHHSEFGKEILKNFAFKICNCKESWHIEDIIEKSISDIKEKALNKKVFCALSGGVDSTVAAELAHRAIGNNLICLHIDNGLMRKDESKNVMEIFKNNLNLNVKLINASEIFISKLHNVINPEEKRKIIGNTFIEVIENEISKIGEIDYLIQGTLFPDLIESTSYKGPSSIIKTHHNVGGLPEKMKLKLIEPLKELFKDEVRIVGKKLNIPNKLLFRHPFPGPGLAVRIIGDVTKEKIKILQEADAIFIDELIKCNLYNKIWQAFCVLLPVKTVGVMGDSRTYENTIVLRAVDSIDGMTADSISFDFNFLKNVSSRIVNEVHGINRVVYDITSKPPSTIEWE